MDGPLTEFNSYERLQFTYDVEDENSISFFNLDIVRNEYNILITNWFRLKTYSERLSNSFPMMLLKKKMVIINKFLDIAILISDESLHEENIKILRDYLLNNYPDKFIKIDVNKGIVRLNNKNRDHNANKLNKKKEVERHKTISISFHGKISNNVKIIMDRNKIEEIFRVESKLNIFNKLNTIM